MSWLRKRCDGLADHWLGDQHEDCAINMSTDMQAIAREYAERALRYAYRWHTEKAIPRVIAEALAAADEDEPL